MTKAYQISDEAFVIPEALPVPGVGKLPVNAMVLRGKEPMILDTLAIVDRAVVLSAGKVIADGPVAEVRRLQDPWIREYFSTRL